MRVEENSLTNAASSTATRAGESQRIQFDTASSGAGGASSTDRVDLSGLAGRISQAMQTLASQSSKRVSRLQADFQAGSYQPDAQQIAEAMVRF